MQESGKWRVEWTVRRVVNRCGVRRRRELGDEEDGAVGDEQQVLALHPRESRTHQTLIDPRLARQLCDQLAFRRHVLPDRSQHDAHRLLQTIVAAHRYTVTQICIVSGEGTLFCFFAAG